MSLILAKVLPYVLRGVGTNLAKGIAGVILRRIAQKTKNTIDDEIVELIYKETGLTYAEDGRAS